MLYIDFIKGLIYPKHIFKFIFKPDCAEILHKCVDSRAIIFVFVLFFLLFNYYKKHVKI